MTRFCLGSSIIALSAMLSTQAHAQDQAPVGTPPAATPPGSAPQSAATPPAVAPQGAATPPMSAPQSAAPVTDAAASQGNDVIVTAQFRSQRLQDTPLAITAVNAAMLEARGQTSIYEITAQAPNVTLAPAAQSYGSGVVAFIRGIGQQDNSYALEPGVGIYVDDVYYSTLAGSLLDLMDLDRVEVLRGPQGTLAGKNSIGGAIKLFTKKPDGTGGGYVQATYGSFNRTEVRGSANVTIVPDKLFMRFSGAAKSEDGYITRLDYGLTHPGSGVPTFATNANPVIGTLGGVSYVAGRAALRWLASSAVEVNLSGDYTNDRSEAGASVGYYANKDSLVPNAAPRIASTITGAEIPYDCRFVAFGPNSCDTLTGYDRRYVTYSNFTDGTPATSQAPFKPIAFDPINHLNSFGVQGTIDVDLSGEVKLKSITAFRHYENRYTHDEDNSPIPVEQLSFDLKHSQFSQELRLNSALLNGKLDTTLGGFYFESHSSTTARVDLNYLDTDFIDGPDKIHTTSKALFAQGIAHLTGALNLTGGVRYSWDDKTYLNRRHLPDGSAILPCAGYPFAPPAPPSCIIAGLDGSQAEAKSTRFDYRAVLDYRFNAQVLGYAQISTGYKGGGVNPYPYYGPGDPKNQVVSFAPETLTTYELGLKTDLDPRIRVNIAGFLNKYKNIVSALKVCPAPNTDADPCDEPANIGSADVYGAELETQIRPVDGLLFDGSFSYLHFKYTKLNGAPQVTLADVTPYTPKYKWSVGAQYDYDIGPGTVTARFDGSYQSHMFAAAVNEPVGKPSTIINAYFLGNGRLSYRMSDSQWQVSLEVRNIFDKYYYLNVVANSPYYSAGPGMPRTWAVTLKRNF